MTNFVLLANVLTMRITGGEFGGRKLACPDQMTRPTQDRVREALFSSLAMVIPGCRFLDLFAGSGAVGLDAFSRGAASVTFVEQDRQVSSVLSRNIHSIRAFANERELVEVREDVLSWLGHFSGNEPFDVIFADPPYDKPYFLEELSVLNHVLRGDVLARDGILVAEQRRKADFFLAPGWELVKEKVYGKSALRYLRLLN